MTQTLDKIPPAHIRAFLPAAALGITELQREGLIRALPYLEGEMPEGITFDMRVWMGPTGCRCMGALAAELLGNIKEPYEDWARGEPLRHLFDAREMTQAEGAMVLRTFLQTGHVVG